MDLFVSSSTTEQAMFYFNDAFVALNSLREGLFDISGQILSVHMSTINTINTINLPDLTFINNDFTEAQLSTLHGSLYEIQNTETDEAEGEADDEAMNSEESTDSIVEGSALPNNRDNPFENSAVLDLTHLPDSDSDNVISIVDDRRETNAVRNIIVSHMNHATEVIPDERNAIRSIRKKIRDSVNKHSEELLSFMVKPIEDLDISLKIKQISNKLSSPNFNPSASWITKDTISFVDNERMNSTIMHNIGCSSEKLSSEIKNLHNTYHNTITKMFELHESIDKKLTMVDSVLSCLKTLPNISEYNPASVSLYSSIQTYVHHEMESNNIEKDYKDYIHYYTMFQKYRSLLQLASSSYVGITETMRPPGALCNICMNENISFALIPCGHTFCNSCTQKTRYSCFICRSNVQQKMKIYIH